MFGGVSGGLPQPTGVAVGAPAVNIVTHRLDKGAQAVLILHHKLQADGFGVIGETVPPGPVFREGVNVGIIPEAGGFNALFPELLDTGHGTGGTADMEQKFHGQILPGTNTSVLYQETAPVTSVSAGSDEFSQKFLQFNGKTLAYFCCNLFRRLL